MYYCGLHIQKKIVEKLIIYEGLYLKKSKDFYINIYKKTNNSYMI